MIEGTPVNDYPNKRGPDGRYRLAFLVLTLAAMPAVLLCLVLALPFIAGARYQPPCAGETENDIRSRLGEPFHDTRDDFDQFADEREFAYQATWIAPNGKRYTVSFDDHQVAQQIDAYSR